LQVLDGLVGAGDADAAEFRSQRFALAGRGEDGDVKTGRPP
jgi:hypothetical protein